jgi:hypothetical protein
MSAWVGAAQLTVDYGTITLSGGIPSGKEVISGNFEQVWDLTKCDMEIRFTIDLSDVSDDMNEFGYVAHVWSQLGVRGPGYPNFDPTWGTEGAGVWMKADYNYSADGLEPAPDRPDYDDFLLLQRGGGNDAGYYNLPVPPPNQWSNYGFWFDRDGVGPVYAGLYGYIDGVTYNTAGGYQVTITLHAEDAVSGTAYMTVNGISQGFYEAGWKNHAPEISPAGMTFTADMTQLQVFYGIYARFGAHTVVFEDIQVTGCSASAEVEIDIKPNSYPNAINIRSHGVIPVAVFSTYDFDATTIDPQTVRLSGMSVATRGKDRSKYMANVKDLNGDGLPDMVLHFQTQSLDLDQIDDDMAVLTGQTYDGRSFIGYDQVTIVPR